MLIYVKKGEQSVVATKLMNLRLLAARGVIGKNIAVTLGKAEKGRYIARHKNKGFEFAFITKGRCIFRYGKKQLELQEGDVVYFDASEWHSVTALEPQEFLGMQFYEE
jgi:quercetin dioxygenase-like cupin family protein